VALLCSRVAKDIKHTTQANKDNGCDLRQSNPSSCTFLDKRTKYLGNWEIEGAFAFRKSKYEKYDLKATKARQ
jgi:hypothetical protein